MSLVLSIRFLTGKFHATPWNHQVNEGVVEYPPSPWRLLRALVSAYYHLPELPPRSQMNELVTVLAGTLPAYQVPPHTTAHTRHYMPTFKEGKNTSTKVLDTFVVFGRARTDTEAEEAQMKAVWEGVELDENLLELLKLLCDNVTTGGEPSLGANFQFLSRMTHRAIAMSGPLDGGEVTTDETVRLLAPLSGGGAGRLSTGDRRGSSQTLTGKMASSPGCSGRARSRYRRPSPSGLGNGVPGARWITYTLPKTFPKADRLPPPTTAFLPWLGLISGQRFYPP